MEKIIDNRVRSAIFQEKKEIAPDTFEFYFKIQGEFNFEPGQYAWLQFDHIKYPDPKGDRRAMSILNTQNSDNTVSFLFRNSTSGFKKTAYELKKGDTVNIIGPFGNSFCLPESKAENLILISGGVGIAPFMSLITHMTNNKLDQKISLFSIHNENRPILYEKELEDFKKINKNLNIHIIHNDFDSKTFDIKKHKNNLYYISGSQSFVNKVFLTLKNLGVNETQMRFENFFPQDESSETLRRIFKKQSLYTDDKENILFVGIQDSSHHLVVTDKNGVIVFANKSAQKITGFTFEEMEGNTPRLWGGLMSKEFYKKLWVSKLAGNIVDEQIINRRKNGELYYVISHISPIKNNTGEVIGFIATEEDITPIKNQEERLIQANNDLQRFSLMTADRELKMMELKKEISELKKKIDEK